MKKTMLTAASAVCVGLVPTLNAGTAVAATPGGTYLVTAQEMAQARTHLGSFSTTLASCDKNLTAKPKPVASLGLANHYDADGKSGSNEQNTLSDDANTVYKLGLCYQLTGKSQYATQAQKIIDAWATTLKSAPTSQGKDAINFAMPSMIGGATWVKGVNGWSGQAFTSFLDKVVLPNNLLSNPNNHGMWAVLTVASAATYGNSSQLMAVAENRWQQIVAGEVRSDGTMPQEMARSDTSNYTGGPTKGIRGIAYTHYTLLAMSVSAKLFANAGQPVWNTTGGALMGKAFDKAVGWTVNPSTFPYYASNHGKLQDTQNGSYFPLLLRTYPNTDAVKAIKAGDTKADTFLLAQLFPLQTSSPSAPASTAPATPTPATPAAGSVSTNSPSGHQGPLVQTDHTFTANRSSIMLPGIGAIVIAGSGLLMGRRRHTN